MKYIRIAAGVLLCALGVGLGVVTWTGGLSAVMLAAGTALGIAVFLAGVCLIASIKSFAEFMYFISFT